LEQVVQVAQVVPVVQVAQVVQVAYVTDLKALASRCLRGVVPVVAVVVDFEVSPRSQLTLLTLPPAKAKVVLVAPPLARPPAAVVAAVVGWRRLGHRPVVAGVEDLRDHLRNFEQELASYAVKGRD